MFDSPQHKDSLSRSYLAVGNDVAIYNTMRDEDIDTNNILTKSFKKRVQ